MAFASTLFSDINSPFGWVISPSKKGTLKNLPEVDIRNLDMAKLAYNEAYYINSPSLLQQLKTVRKDLLNKAICFISKFVGCVSYSKRDKLHDLREVVAEIGKFNINEFSASQKEVLIACYMVLGKELKGVDANKEFYSELAAQLAEDVLTDQKASLATISLTCGRVS